MGVISHSDSLYNLNPTMAKKSNGDPRFAMNLIPVNDQIMLPQYPATFIDEVCGRAVGKGWISILDLKDAYW